MKQKESKRSKVIFVGFSDEDAILNKIVFLDFNHAYAFSFAFCQIKLDPENQMKKIIFN